MVRDIIIALLPSFVVAVLVVVGTFLMALLDQQELLKPKPQEAAAPLEAQLRVDSD